MKKLRFIIPAGLIIVFAITYFAYASSLLNINNEKSILNYLSVDNDSSINLLAQKRYGEYFGVLYIDENDENNEMIYFSYFKKHPLYNNRYKPCGYVSTSSGAYYAEITNEHRENPEFFIFGGKSDEETISVFETENGEPVNKLSEINAGSDPYIIIVEKFDLQNYDNDIMVFEGSYLLDELLQYYRGE